MGVGIGGGGGGDLAERVEYSVDLKVDIVGASDEALMDHLLDHPELRDRGPAGSWWDGGLSLRFDVEAVNPVHAIEHACVLLKLALPEREFTLRAVEAQPVQDLERQLVGKDDQALP